MAVTSDKEVMCVQFLIDNLGWTDYQASALVGCMIAESNITPTAVNSGEKNGTLKSSGACNKGTAYGTKNCPWSYGAGIIQWTFCDRKENALQVGLGYSKSLAQQLIMSKGIESLSLEQQLKMVVGEINKGSFKSNFGVLMPKCKNLKEAVSAVFCRFLGGISSNTSIPSESEIKKLDKAYDAANGKAISGFSKRVTYADKVLRKYRLKKGKGENVSYDESFTRGSDSESAFGNGNNQLNSRDAAAMAANADTVGEEPGLGKGLDPNNTLNKGTLYPVIKINDTFISYHEIVEFYIETGWFKNPLEYLSQEYMKTGFVPTMHLVILTASNSLFKHDTIKAGDKCNVFFRQSSAAIKSYRGDFVITKVMTDEKPSERAGVPATFIIDGELWVPMLRNETAKTTISGTSRDVLIEIAKRLQLGFFFDDPEDTDDYQCWQIQSSLYDAAIEISSRAWSQFEKFYECFIDPRYGMSFLELNKLLIADGLDEQLDLTSFSNTIFSSVGIDGRKIQKTEEESKNTDVPQAKIFSNVVRDKDSVTPFYVKKWSIVNRAAEMTNAFGIYKESTFNMDNPGLSTDNTSVSMDYSIPLNTTKLRNGFYVLIGPGVNLTYTQADQINSAQSFVSNSQQVTGGSITDVMSDGDADSLRQTGSNMMASGNVNKFYEVGYEHNKKNLVQLEKQYLQVELAGCNVAIMRGEKIPVLLIDNDLLMQKNTWIKTDANGNPQETSVDLLQKMIILTASGWYIIDGVKWEWKRQREEDDVKGSTLWRTYCKLKRREWPIVGYGTPDGLGRDIVFENVVNTAVQPTKTAETPAETTNENVGAEEEEQQSEIINEDIAEEDNVGGDVPLTGLKEPLKNLYNILKSKCSGIRLVSARRWAVDEKGNRTDGNAFVMKNGLYKCVNANGKLMYFLNNNSRHLYGEAFDIVNVDGLDFDGIMTDYVLKDAEILKAMGDYGISACIEATTDDSGVKTKHYHFGTDPEIVSKFWYGTVNKISPELMKSLYISMVSLSTNKKKIYSQEITHNTVNEA